MRPLLRALPFVAFALACFARAQMPASLAVPDPVVHADRTVTFTFAEPAATHVGLALEGTRAPLPMLKSAAGVWTVTTSALAPEWYSYHFDVDGRTELDPRNVTVKASYTSAGNGFLVPAATPEPWEPQAVPHGTVHRHTYTTHVVTGLDRDQADLWVYTPPGYDARAAAKYPVLYLLHGWSDTAGGWVNIGHAAEIFDALIARGTMRPMVVAMPLGYGQMSFVRSGFGVWQDAAAVRDNVVGFGRSLIGEVMPLVESAYTVSPKREDRAITGLSMGGLESLAIGLKHPELFAYVGGFSSALLGRSAEALAPPAKANPLRLVWVACGTEDELIEPNRNAVAVLKGEGYAVTAVETPGMHTWLVWRDNLVHFAPLLFQPEAK